MRLRRINLVVIASGAGSLYLQHDVYRGSEPEPGREQHGERHGQPVARDRRQRQRDGSAGVALQNYYFAGYVQDNFRIVPG